MANIQDLGRVKGDKGDKGDTYVPNIRYTDDKFIIDWQVNNVTQSSTELKLPYYVPIKTANGGLSFVKNTTIENANSIATFSPEELKGADGKIDIEFVSELPSDEDAKTTVLYVINNDESSDNQNIYGFDADSQNENKWVILDSPIKFNDYMLKTDAEARFASIQNNMDIRIGQILEQQYAISQLLGGAIIDDVPASEDSTIIQVVSNAQLEDLKQEILNEALPHAILRIMGNDNELVEYKTKAFTTDYNANNG